MFWQRGYKWDYINGSLKGLGLYFAQTFNSQTSLPMVLTNSLSESWRVFFPIDAKEQNLIIPLVISLRLYMEFHKSQFWVPYFSITFCDILSKIEDFSIENNTG